MIKKKINQWQATHDAVGAICFLFYFHICCPNEETLRELLQICNISVLPYLFLKEQHFKNTARTYVWFCIKKTQSLLWLLWVSILCSVLKGYKILIKKVFQSLWKLLHYKFELLFGIRNSRVLGYSLPTYIDFTTLTFVYFASRYSL